MEWGGLKPPSPPPPPPATAGETLAWTVGREVFPEWQIESLQMKWNQSRRPPEKKNAPAVFAERTVWQRNLPFEAKVREPSHSQLPQDVAVVLQPWDLNTSVTGAISIFLY